MQTDFAFRWAEELSGRVVEVVCFASYAITINFDDKSLLQIEGGYELLGADGSVEFVTALPTRDSSLHRLAGSAVATARLDQTAPLLEIRFVDGAVLVLRRTSIAYESFRVIKGLEEQVF